MLTAHIRSVFVALVWLVVAALASPTTSFAGHATPLARAHAHNDFAHERPLLDALDHGFTSVEADIWLVGGELLVAHDLPEVQPDRTLESLYLAPLRRVVMQNNGSVYPAYEHYFTLLIDIKSEAVSTYRVLHQELRRYQFMLTRFGPRGVKDGAVTAIVSGNRPRELMEGQRIRYAAYDGRMSDLGTGVPATFIPLISDNWTTQFTWMGEGDMPEDQRRRLRAIVTSAHANGQRVRFWATPDNPGEARENVWRELLAAEVDFINTDHLADLQTFLVANDPNPSEPYVTWADSNGRSRMRKAS